VLFREIFLTFMGEGGASAPPPSPEHAYEPIKHSA